MKKIIIFLILSVFLTGCIEFDSLDGMLIVDTVSISPSGKVAVCFNTEGSVFSPGRKIEVYITDLSGSSFSRITENDNDNSSVSWSDDSELLLYTEEKEKLWKLNLYSVKGKKTVELLQEMYRIVSPKVSHDGHYITYIAYPSEDSLFGNLNVHEIEPSSVYTLMDNIYYNYILLPYNNKVVAVNVTEDFENIFKGVLVIKDIKEQTEKIVFNGYFHKEGNVIDIAADGKTIVFCVANSESEEKEIYLYDIRTDSLSKWTGPDGYEITLPASSLGGYLLAHVKGNEDGWSGQLYLISLDNNIIGIPGWPVWKNEQKVVCIDIYEGSVLVTDLEINKTINLSEKFREYYDKQEEN